MQILYTDPHPIYRLYILYSSRSGHEANCKHYPPIGRFVSFFSISSFSSSWFHFHPTPPPSPARLHRLHRRHLLLLLRLLLLEFIFLINNHSKKEKEHDKKRERERERERGRERERERRNWFNESSSGAGDALYRISKSFFSSTTSAQSVFVRSSRKYSLQASIDSRLICCFHHCQSNRK